MMVIYLLIILGLMLYKIKIHIKDFNKDYLSRDNTLSIKGIFVLLVFFRHCVTYVTLSSGLDKPMIILDNFLRQSIVTMFFFYSGYGIYEQIKKNKTTYIKNFPRKRIARTLFDFAIAIISFLIMDLILCRKYRKMDIALSFIGWTSIGNSNWYMFCTFALYIFVLLAFLISKKNDKISLIIVTIFSMIYMVVVGKLKNPIWIDTTLCFVIGMWYSYYKEKVEKLITRNSIYIICSTILIGIYGLMNYLYFINYKTYMYIIISSVFCILVVLITMKISINNKILSWFGRYVFWIYILQRIPMIVFSKLGLTGNAYIFFIISFVTTIVMSVIYTKAFEHIRRILFEPNKTKLLKQ